MNIQRLLNRGFCLKSAFGRRCRVVGSVLSRVSTEESVVLVEKGLSLPRWLRTSAAGLGRGRDDRKMLIDTMPTRDEGADGERSFDISSESKLSVSMFPDKDTGKMMVEGVAFSDLPICHIKVTLNNTLMTLVDHKGNEITRRTCGMEGFKNAKKGTNIAAQATALTLGTTARECGVKDVRVKIRGLGPGRMSSLKGLLMSGMNVVSISDCTPIPHNGPRPRKRRKL